MGDTFRWKGHNISTTEVESILNIFKDVSISCVYGVKIPRADGRAGMATIVPVVNVKDFDFKGLEAYLKENLAHYAVPIFLRFKSDVALTSTLKLKKAHLKKEGFDIRTFDNPLHVLLPEESKYTLLTKEIYDNIQNNKYKF